MKIRLPEYTAASLVILMVALSGCTSSAGVSPSTAEFASLKNDVQPIFNANCVVCHQGSSPPAGLSLEPGAAYRNLVNALSTQSPLMRVAPGAPEKSYLIDKLRGTQSQVGGSGMQMPYGASPLPGSQIGLIEQWIAAGAPNN